MLAVVLLQGKVWARWPAEVPLNQYFCDSLPIQKMQAKYGFLWQQKDIICFVLGWFLNTYWYIFTFFIRWSPGWCSHRAIFITPGLSFLRSNDQITPYHSIPEVGAFFLLCCTLHLSTLNSTVILLLGYSHKLSCKYQGHLIFINLNNLIASSGFVTWLRISFPDHLWICQIMQHKAGCHW